MKTTLLLLGLAFALARPVAAEEIADGLFLRSDDASARTVKDPEGRVYGLGEKCACEILKAEVISHDNRNQEFSLSLKIPFGEGANDIRHVLVIRGTAWAQTGAGSEAAKFAWLNFTISGRDNADAVAALFGVKPALRTHPGHRLAVSYTPAEEEFDLEGSKMVTLRIENVGDKPVFLQVGGRNESKRDNQFVFRVTNGDRTLPDPGSSIHFGGLSTIRTIKPGEVIEAQVDLAQWFAPEKPGVYFALGSWLMTFFDGPEYTHPVWEDWATAEFVVRIKDKTR